MENINTSNIIQEDNLISYQFFGSDDPFVYFISEEEQLDLIRRNKNFIISISRPTEKVIREAYAGDEERIMKIIQYNNRYTYLNELTEEEQLTKVIKDERLIEYIDNPTERLQLAALEKSNNAVRYIRNPTEEVQRIAISNDLDTLADLRFITPIEKTIEILKEKLSYSRVKKAFIIEFLQCTFIIGDKMEFINRYGSKKAKRVAMELHLSVLEMVTKEGQVM